MNWCSWIDHSSGNRRRNEGRGVMAVDVQELARRMLADYDAHTPGGWAREPVTLTTGEAHAVQSEIARLRERCGETIIGYKVGWEL
jgi:hypothetical protein